MCTDKVRVPTFENKFPKEETKVVSLETLRFALNAEKLPLNESDRPFVVVGIIHSHEVADRRSATSSATDLPHLFEFDNQ